MIGISVVLGVGSLIGLYYMLIYINVVLQLELFGLADAEFPPDKIDIYYKYMTVYFVCGIIILLLVVMQSFTKDKLKKLELVN